MKKFKYYSGIADNILMTLVYILLWLSMIAILVPFVFIIAASFSSPSSLAAGKVLLWPVNFTLKGYGSILQSPNILSGFVNSIKYTAIGTLINVSMTMLAAYPLSRKDLRGRNFVMVLFTITMLFSGGLIPTYLLVKDLKLIDTLWAMVLPNAMSVFNVIIARTFIQSTIPNDLYESASIDGCSDFKFVLQIIIPLSKPIIAVLTLLYAVAHWNSFFNALIYLNDAKKQPLQMVLRDILVMNNTGNVKQMDLKQQMEQQQMIYLLQYSTIIVSSLPVMLMYPFIQKYFVKGIMIGAIKG